MEIIRELTEIPNLSLALGFFDGIHLGHQSVINCAVEFAKDNDCASAVVSFQEHPYCYFKKESPKYILTLDDKHKIMEDIGLDYLIELDFGSVCHMTPTEYLEDVLVKYFSPKAISTGFNHKFGVDKSGNVIFLSDCQEKYDYIYFATPPQSIYGDVISSTLIRQHIKSGSVFMANSMLGRKFSVEGTVVKGKELGATLGYPTANIIYPSDIIEPPFGVYEVEVLLDDGKTYKGLANFGTAPTVSDGNTCSLETYILNFKGNLYDKNIKVSFVKMIRPEIKFGNTDELKTQISIDLQSIK